MVTITNILTGLVAALQFYFLVLEMFLWEKPRTLAKLKMTPEFARTTATLAKNQGLYNGFLSAGLVWGLVTGESRIQLFFLLCVLTAGVYGAATASKNILFLQALPAGLALTSLLLSY
jgi:putative membrane protein